MSYARNTIVATLIIFLAIFVYFSFFWENPYSETEIIGTEETFGTALPDVKTENRASVPERTMETEAEEAELPESALLDVPFLVQAPFANWDPLHEDACEEASLLMVKYFLDEKKSISPVKGDVEIRKMVAYEEENGYGLSITMEQLERVATDYSKMENPRVEKNITIEDIKRELAEGRPVIVPAAGKILPNPYFRDGGPVYHMLVVVGYDGKGFITNDPGTRRGEGFRYAFGDLYRAIHDWDEGDIFRGQKAYLVFD